MRAWQPVLAALAATAVAAAAEAQTVKLGIVSTYSGPNASIGDQMQKGIDLYIKEYGKNLGGIKLEVIKRDDTGPAPDVAKRMAQELITRDRVQLLGGIVYTPNANAIAPLATEAKVPTIIMNAGTSSTIRLSPYLARVSFTLWQSSYPLGQWAAKQPGVKKAYTAVTDYGPGHDGEAAFTKGFTEAGGEMVGSVRMPIQNPDFIPFMQRVKDTKPDVLFVFVPAGRVAVAVMKAYTDLGLPEAGIRLMGPGDITPDDELPNMAGVPEGIITMHHYSAAADRPANKAFVQAWKREYGEASNPSFFGLGGWDGMAAFFHVIQEQKGRIDPDKTMELLKGWRNDQSPRGPMMINPQTRDIVHNEYLRRLQRVNGQLANVEFETIPMVEDPWPKFNPAR